VAQSGHTMSFLPKAWSDALPGEAGPSDSYIISTFGIQGKCPIGGCAEHGTYGEALAPGRWDPASYQGAFAQMDGEDRDQLRLLPTRDFAA
jgi:hypothetical protein